MRKKLDWMQGNFENSDMNDNPLNEWIYITNKGSRREPEVYTLVPAGFFHIIYQKGQKPVLAGNSMPWAKSFTGFSVTASLSHGSRSWLACQIPG